MTLSEISVQTLPSPTWNIPIFRRIAKQVSDALLAGFAWVVADQLWFVSQPSVRRTLIWVAVTMAVGAAFRLTSLLYRLTAIRDVMRLGYATVFLLGLSISIKFLPRSLGIDPQVPTISAVASLLTGMLWSTVRLGRRTVFEKGMISFPWTKARGLATHPTLLVGAGKAGSMVAQELLEHPELGYRIVGFIDDSPEKKGAYITGIQILGDTSQIAAVTQEYGITHAVLAIPTASGQTIRKLVEDFQSLQVKVKTVPGIFNLLGTRTWKPDIQEISIEDVLRREPVQLDHSAMSEVVKGKVVLITGAGGSIGSELTRQVAALNPKSIVLLGRGENSLWQIQREMQTNWPSQDFFLALMDIRNRAGIREIFERFQPEIVLHAAAHKHVPFLELHPSEAVENNILGTFNVMEAALDFKAQKVVNISTDKAVNPTNVLGASKRIAECVVLDMAARAAPGTCFVCVRFGNVLGSRGSVVPIFKEQIEQGGPITVTHAEMTRFFMTIPEASQLVLQAALFGDTQRVYVLKMGDPVKILDLAYDMARLSGLTPNRDIKIEISGLRPGEKIHEELFMDDERIQTTVHPKLMETNPQAIPPEILHEHIEAFRKAVLLPYEERQPELVRLMRALVPTYTPSLLGVGKYGGHVKNRRKETIPPQNTVERRGKALQVPATKDHPPLEASPSEESPLLLPTQDKII